MHEKHPVITTTFTLHIQSNIIYAPSRCAGETRAAATLEKLKKVDFFKIYQLLTPTVIIENTQLGKVFSLLKMLERCFNAEDEKMIFT